MLEVHDTAAGSTAPVTLHGVMQNALSSDLRTHYGADKDIPHSLLVLMMQIADPAERKAMRRPRRAAAASSRKVRRA